METKQNRQIAQDRETIISEILNELEKDALKKEVIAKLKESPKRISLLQILQHPVFLLILGFTLTAIVGNRLASRWQIREWERQQVRLVQLRKVDVKYALINDVVKSYAESYLPIQDVFKDVWESQGVKGEIDDSEKQKKLKHLLDSIPSFAKNYGIVGIQLSIYFKDRRVYEVYINMMGKAQAKGYLQGLESYYKTRHKNRGTPAEFVAAKYRIKLDEVALDLGKTDKQLGELITLMNNEIEGDIAGRTLLIPNIDSTTSPSTLEHLPSKNGTP